MLKPSGTCLAVSLIARVHTGLTIERRLATGGLPFFFRPGGRGGSVRRRGRALGGKFIDIVQHLQLEMCCRSVCISVPVSQRGYIGTSTWARAGGTPRPWLCYKAHRERRSDDDEWLPRGKRGFGKIRRDEVCDGPGVQSRTGTGASGKGPPPMAVAKSRGMASCAARLVGSAVVVDSAVYKKSRQAAKHDVLDESQRCRQVDYGVALRLSASGRPVVPPAAVLELVLPLARGNHAAQGDVRVQHCLGSGVRRKSNKMTETGE